MRSKASLSALIGIVSCVASFLAGIAYADGFRRPPPAALETVGTADAIEYVVPVFGGCRL